MMQSVIAAPKESEFRLYQQLIQEKAGIFLAPQKIHLLNGRLAKRLHSINCASYRDYFELISSKQGNQELQTAIDLITTNETYFFREPKHFDFLHNHLVTHRADATKFRVWSAASSTGEEAYSIAMLLSDVCEKPWQIIASDISTDVLERAKKAIYSEKRTQGISDEFRRRYCRQGVGEFEGHLRIVPSLRSRVEFQQINLIKSMPEIGLFDFIFLRNVMIYFMPETQEALINRLCRHIKPGGYLFIGHSESLQAISTQNKLRPVQPAIYQKV